MVLTKPVMFWDKPMLSFLYRIRKMAFRLRFCFHWHWCQNWIGPLGICVFEVYAFSRCRDCAGPVWKVNTHSQEVPNGPRSCISKALCGLVRACAVVSTGRWRVENRAVVSWCQLSSPLSRLTRHKGSVRKASKPQLEELWWQLCPTTYDLWHICILDCGIGAGLSPYSTLLLSVSIKVKDSFHALISHTHTKSFFNSTVQLSTINCWLFYDFWRSLG